MYNLVLVGAGKWGKNYINTINTKFEQEIVLTVANRENWKKCIDDHPDGVIIATPPQSHIEIASYALSKCIPTIIEKPLCLSLPEAKTLEQFKAPILVNHIHLFSSQYQKLKSIVEGEQITKIVSKGYNKAPIRNWGNKSVIYDYAPHDLAIILDLSKRMPIEVNFRETMIGYEISMRFDNFSTRSEIGNNAQDSRRYLEVDFDDLRISYEDDRNAYFTPLYYVLKVFLDAIDGKNDKRLGLDLSFKILEILSTINN